MFRQALLQYFPSPLARIHGLRYIGVPHRVQVTFGYLFGSLMGVWFGMTPAYFITFQSVKVHAFWKTGGVHPSNHVPNLKARVLDVHAHAVLGARTGERQQVTSWLEHSQALGPRLNVRHIVVPMLTHEAETVGRVAHDGIHAVVRHQGQHFLAATQHQPRRVTNYLYRGNQVDPRVCYCLNQFATPLLKTHSCPPRAVST